MTIKGRLLGTVLGGFLVLFVLMGAAYLWGGSKLDALLKEAGTESVVQSAVGIREVLEQSASVLETSAGSLRHAYLDLGAVSRDAMARAAAALLHEVRDRGVKDLFWGYESDGRFADGNGDEVPESFDARERPWYKLAVSAGAGEVVCTEPYRFHVGNALGVTMALAVRDHSGRLLGVVGADLDLEALGARVAELRLLGQGVGVLVQRDGLIVASTRKTDIMKANLLTDSDFPEGLRQAARRMTAGETGVSEYRLDGEKRLMFHAPAGYGLYLGTAFPYSVVSGLLRSLVLVLAAVAATPLLLVAISFFWIIRGMARSIRKLTSGMEGLEAGDLSTRFDESGRDEFARVSGMLNRLAASLGEMIGSIRSQVSESARQAEGLEGIAKGLLASMEEVGGLMGRSNTLLGESASALESVNAAIGEVASGAQASAHAATEGASQSSLVSDGTTQGVHNVGRIVEGMRAVERQSGETTEQIEHLAQSVEAISGFVTSITSIADQTNLLALNAAIEAARAGEAGRGFAVVAEEVRKLAEESGNAAKEVSKLIETLQQRSGSSLSATREMVRHLEELVAGAESVDKELQSVLGATNSLNESIQNVAAVSEEQAASAEEMTASVQSVTTSIQEVVEVQEELGQAAVSTVDVANDIARHAQSVAEAAEGLKGLADRFRTGEDGMPALKG